MYPSVLHYRYADRKALSEIPYREYAAERTEFPSACSGGYDRICRNFSPDHSTLGEPGADFAGRDKLDFGSYFCRGNCSAPKIQNESDPSHGAGGCGESRGIFCGFINPGQKRIINQTRETPEQGF